MRCASAIGCCSIPFPSRTIFPEQAWADTLFMAAYFMLRYGVLTGEKALVDDALHQYARHIEYLQDKATGLWYHGYNNLRKTTCPASSGRAPTRGRPTPWRRSSARLPEPYLYPPFMDIDCSVRDQLAGLKKLQTEDGLWRTVLNDPESYEELSASCGIAAAMVKNGNPLHTRLCAEGLFRHPAKHHRGRAGD